MALSRNDEGKFSGGNGILVAPITRVKPAVADNAVDMAIGIHNGQNRPDGLAAASHARHAHPQDKGSINQHKPGVGQNRPNINAPETGFDVNTRS
jgi:hypothetical protein